MSIEKLKSGKFRARIYQNGKKVASSQAFDKRKDAVFWETEYKQRAIKGLLCQPMSTVSILECVAEFSKRYFDKSTGHKNEVLYVIAKFLDEFDIEKPEQFTSANIRSFIRSGELSSYTISRYTNHILTFARFLHEEGYVGEDPSLNVKRPKGKSQKEQRALREDELSEVLNSIQLNCPKLYFYYSFLALTGCRKMEACTLEWNDIDFSNRVLRIRNKDHVKIKNEPFRCKWGSSRSIPMSDDLINLLFKIPNKSGFVFKTQRGSMLRNNLYRDLKAAIQDCPVDRVEEIGIHTFRHTWITLSLQNGLDLFTVSKYVGHRNISTTERYLHFHSTKDKMRIDTNHFPKLHPRRTHKGA